MLFRVRRFAPVALAAALHTTLLTVPTAAWAEAPKPSGVVKSQQDLISRGQTLFDDQQYEESIQALSGALVRPSNTKEQKVQIYRLLALNYITLNRKDEAESAVRGLLVLDQGYSLPSSESPRFRDFFAGVKQKWEAEGKPGLTQETAAVKAVSMQHVSPSEAKQGSAIDLTAHLDDPGGRVVEVKLYFRAGSKGVFQQTTTALEDGAVKGTIPTDSVKPPLVEYYFEGVDKGGLPIVSRGDAGAPLRVGVPDGAKSWVLPVAIGGSVLGAAAIVGALALAGVFKGSSSSNPNPNPGTGPGPGPGPGQTVVNVSVGQAWH